MAKLGWWRQPIAIDSQRRVCLAVSNPVKRVTRSVRTIRSSFLARGRSLLAFFFASFFWSFLTLFIVFSQSIELSQVGKSFALGWTARFIPFSFLLFNTFFGSWIDGSSPHIDQALRLLTFSATVFLWRGTSSIRLNPSPGFHLRASSF